MMDTILDLGLNDQTLNGLIAKTGDARFGYDSLRRFIMMFGDVVLGIDRGKFDAIFEEAKEKSGVDVSFHAKDSPARACRETKLLCTLICFARLVSLPPRLPFDTATVPANGPVARPTSKPRS